MSLQHFISEAVSPWMINEGPDSDIVMSSRVRFARNLKNYVFPILSNREHNLEVIEEVRNQFTDVPDGQVGQLELIEMDDLKPIEKRVIVEMHLVSPNLI